MANAGTVPRPEVRGWAARDFAHLRDALETNLRTGDDQGATVAVYRHGTLVADLWGGVSQDGQTPYPRDALQVVFVDRRAPGRGALPAR